MNKTLKSILAITLALILSFGTLTAFAANGDTLEWYFDGELIEYTWQGELTEGSHSIPYETDEETYLSYTLNANDGYSFFSYSYPMDMGYIDWIGIPNEVKDGAAYDVLSPIYVSDSMDDNGRISFDFIFKLDAGETIVGVDAYSFEENTDMKLSVEYLGESVTDFNISKTDLIGDYDVYLGETEGWLYTDINATFSNGKTKDLKYCELSYTCDEITEGENVLTAKFEDVEKDFAVTVTSVDSYIESAELSNAEEYRKMYVDYNRDYWYYPVNDEVVTITFADSTQQDVFIYDGIGYVEFPNGNEYTVYVYIDSDYDDNYHLYVTVCDKVIQKYDCETIKCDIVENGAILVEDNKSEFVDFLNNLYWGLDNALMFNNVSDILHSLFGTAFDTLIGAANLFSSLFENILTFIKFYLVG